ncbi:MAG: divergent polysaccharide deacetylase family protein [Paracoccaceae bacterium]
MGRGFFSGVLWGSVLSVMSLWLLSQIAETVGFSSDPPKDVAMVAPTSGDVTTSGDQGNTPQAPELQVAPATDPSLQVSGLEQVDAEEAPQTETTSAAVPDAEETTVVQSSPEQDQGPVVVAPAETSAQSTVEILPPVLPGVQANVDDNLPAPAPQTQSTQASAPQAPEIPVVVAEAVPTNEVQPTPVTEPAQPVQPISESVPESDFSAPVVVETPVPVVVEPEPEPVAPSQDQVPASDTQVTTNGTALVVDRTSREPDEETPDDSAVASEGDEPEEVLEIPAIQKYAQAFENLEGRPLMAIVLLVDGDAPEATTPSQKLPFPVSYVVDASKDNAKAVMSAYRAGGNEVAMLAPLPAGAAPKDVEVAFQTYLAKVPEAVAVMDIPDAMFQSGRNVATQVAEALAASGLGMITYSRGLNSATQVAEREGVPAALVFRVFDDDDRDGEAIKRFLDQAAFRAGQQTGVILVGHNRPETVTALLEWGLGNRASTVALAPVSVALLSNQ